MQNFEQIQTYYNKFILSKKEIKNYENNNNPIAGLSDKGTPGGRLVNL
jgi:hypothetical protein